MAGVATHSIKITLYRVNFESSGFEIHSIKLELMRVRFACTLELFCQWHVPSGKISLD
jgi:hypothetical protein